MSSSISKKILVQFEPTRFEWRYFKNAKKRDIRKNSHFEMTVSPKLRHQMQFSDRHFKVLQKIFQIPVGKSIYL